MNPFETLAICVSGIVLIGIAGNAAGMLYSSDQPSRLKRLGKIEAWSAVGIAVLSLFIVANVVAAIGAIASLSR